MPLFRLRLFNSAERKMLPAEPSVGRSLGPDLENDQTLTSESKSCTQERESNVKREKDQPKNNSDVMSKAQKNDKEKK